MSLKRKILTIHQPCSEDEDIKEQLENDGYDVIFTAAGEQASEMAQSHCPDLVLLDFSLPYAECVAFVHKLHLWTHTPVVVMAAPEQLDCMPYALENGADDFILKPFDADELLSRVKVALRNSAHDGSNSENIRENRFAVGSLIVDYDKCRVLIAGVDARLTQNEFRIVALLGKNAGRVIPYNVMISELWGPNAQQDNQILRVNIANIRRKIEPDTAHPRYIITIAGIGYRMAER